MAAACAAEFCLFIPLSLRSSSCSRIPFHAQVANQIAACFSDDGELSATACCAASHEGSMISDHEQHFVLVKIPFLLLSKCALLLRPDMNSDQSALIHSVHNLPPGQAAWLAELALRSVPLIDKEFRKLLAITQLKTDTSHWDESLDLSRPNLFLLQRLGLVSEVVLRHNKQQRRQLWSTYCQRLHVFPYADDLRHYFGDSVGFYFSWMRTYALFLAGPALVGVLCAVSSVLASMSFNDSPIVKSWTLLSIHTFFALFMVIWALVCTKMWTRQHALLVECWSTSPLLEQLANDLAWLHTLFDQRPEFVGQWRLSPVTGLMERHFPLRKRRLRYLFSIVIIVVCLILASLVHVVLLNLEGYVTETKSNWLYISFIGRFTSNGACFDPNIGGLLSYIPGVVHSLLIFVMNQVIFYRIAWLLTEGENHQGQEDFDRALIVKRFLFEMLDAYGCLAYVGFVLADRDALVSLVSIMLITDIARRFVLECGVPFLVYRFRIWRVKRQVGLHKRSSEQGKESTLHPTDFNREFCAESYEPFDDYLEMVLQHGYLVLFAHVAPYFGPLISFLSVLVEAHSDSLKMLWITRRPSPRLLLRGHFIWLDLLAAQAWLSILTNVGLFTVSLSSLELDLSYSLLFMCLEHFLVLVGVAIHFFVQDYPVNVRDARRARDFKRALSGLAHM